MAFAKFNEISISGIACAMPENHDVLMDHAKEFGAEAIQKYSSNVGIFERYIVKPGQMTSDLCFCAAKAIMEHKSYAPDDIDGILLVTQTPDYVGPATSHILHKRLNLPMNCMAMDISLGCSGFIYGVHTAASLIAAGGLRRVLLCVGDVHSPLIRETSANEMMFGDAGTATIIESGDGTINSMLFSDGQRYETLVTPGVLGRIMENFEHPDIDRVKSHMDGSAVFEFTITDVPSAFKAFYKETDTISENYDYCILHQANLMILKHLQKRLKFSEDKIPRSLDRYGNTNGASIPVTIADLCMRDSTPDTINLINSGFGIGLSWGINNFTIKKSDVLPIIHTSEVFEEAYRG